MPNFSEDENELPHRPTPLGLKLSFPSSCLSSIQQGYEAQSQDDKWSIHYRIPWIQIWRPTLQGFYCYAIRLEQTDGQRIHVVESWAGSQILDPQRGLGPDLDRHREIVTWLLDFVADFSGEHFQLPGLSPMNGAAKTAYNSETCCVAAVTTKQRLLFDFSSAGITKKPSLPGW